MSAAPRIYLDYAATTPVHPTVLAAMLPYFKEDYGNPAAVHAFGQRSEATLEAARQQMATLLHCAAEEVIFTSGGTESDNLAVRGAALAARAQRGARHLLLSPTEHDAVAKTAQSLAETADFAVEYLPVDRFGQVSPADVAQRIRPDTALVSVIHASNEIGSLNPIGEIGAICRERGVLFHSDAVQAAAHFALDVAALQVDLLSVGAHKLYGPKGIGALYIRKGSPLLAQQTGGGQENSLRSGTPNVPAIVGMAAAFELLHQEAPARTAHLSALRDKLIAGVLEAVPGATLTGHPSQRLPNHASFVFPGVDANALLMLLDNAGFACSSGAACKTGNPEPSAALLALGLSAELALSALRVSLGIYNTAEEIDALLGALPALVEQARQLEPA